MPGRPWIIVLILLLVTAPWLTAQAPVTPSPSPSGASGPPEAPPIIQFFLAAGFLAVIIMILCMPSRKSR